MPTSENCKICERPSEVDLGGGGEIYIVKCPFCGTYYLAREAYINLSADVSEKFGSNKYLFSGALRERIDNGFDEVIKRDDIMSIYRSVNVPKFLREKLDKIILYCYGHMTRIMDEIIIPTTPAIGYAKDITEFSQMVHLLKTEETFTGSQTFNVAFTVKGIERAEKLLSKTSLSDQCFVAMWFDKDLADIFNKYIVPAVEGKSLDGKILEDEKHYKPVRIDIKDDFNDDILDNIISEIRKSRFVIADFTGNRNGVYYEAGFANGLGLEVIYTCRSDNFKEMHFDVNHKNYIVWENGEELYKRLLKRISASIL